jgi:hypothetical protein
MDNLIRQSLKEQVGEREVPQEIWLRLQRDLQVSPPKRERWSARRFWIGLEVVAACLLLVALVGVTYIRTLQIPTAEEPLVAQVTPGRFADDAMSALMKGDFDHWEQWGRRWDDRLDLVRSIKLYDPRHARVLRGPVLLQRFSDPETNRYFARYRVIYEPVDYERDSEFVYQSAPEMSRLKRPQHAKWISYDWKIDFMEYDGHWKLEGISAFPYAVTQTLELDGGLAGKLEAADQVRLRAGFLNGVEWGRDVTSGQRIEVANALYSLGEQVTDADRLSQFSAAETEFELWIENDGFDYILSIHDSEWASLKIVNQTHVHSDKDELHYWLDFRLKDTRLIDILRRIAAQP